MIIGLTGFKGVGKDTVGQYLVDKYEFDRLAFADKLKEAVANLFAIHPDDVDMYKNMDDIRCGIFSPTRTDNRDSNFFRMREFLQRFGTEMGRNTFGRDFWVEQWEAELYRNSYQTGNVVATDVRFSNEAYRILHLGGRIVEIVRPGYKSDGHESELGLTNDLIDVQIINDSDIESLHRDVDELMKGILDASGQTA